MLYLKEHKQLPFQDPSLPLEKRLKDLLARLTPEEKISLLHSMAPAIPRLGITEYHHGNEALHGVIRPGKATVFPQAIGLASTWNPKLVFQVATAISDEARAKHHAAGGRIVCRHGGLLTFWSPVVNMARDPRWGRTQETYGEDPYLTARMGVAFVKGLQGDDPDYLKTVATPKHYAANNEEHNRFHCNAKISERTLREYYLPGFQACIIEGKAYSIMSAYNAINGIPCSANEKFLKAILRDEWGFEGYVVCDCGALSFLLEEHHYPATFEEAASMAINAGVDLECGDKHIFKNYLKKALSQGLTDGETLNKAAARVLKGRFRLGMFDSPQRVSYAKIPYNVVGAKKHTDLALQAARESIVLLKNESVKGEKLLPFQRSQIHSIAIVGPNTDRCQFGDYSGIPVHEPISPLKGLLSQAGKEIDIHLVKWLFHKKGQFEIIPAENFFSSDKATTTSGLRGEYFNNENLLGEPTYIRIDPTINFDWSGAMPDPNIVSKQFSVRWTGKLISHISGGHYLSVICSGGFRLYLNSQLLIDRWGDTFTETEKILVDLKAGEYHSICLEVFSNYNNVRISLKWCPPANEDFTREIYAARNCDVVIAVLGLDTTIETEGLDRITLDLPKEQKILVQEIIKVNPKTVVVLKNGSPLSINWISKNVSAIIEAWYPGEQGGNAIAEVLFGDFNPGGRLPITFYTSVEQLPPFDDYEISRGRTYMYLKEAPLYPFGYGLSYTTFEYSNLRITHPAAKKKDSVSASVDVENTGAFDGDEVVQVYIRHFESSVIQPIRQLKGFQRLHLARGEKRKVGVTIPVKALSFYSKEEKKFIVESGNYEIQVGASSSDIRLKDCFRIPSVYNGQELKK